MKKIVTVLFIGCLFTACSQEVFTSKAEKMNEGSNIVNHRISVEQAKTNAVEFVSNLLSKTRYGMQKELEVNDVQIVSLQNLSTRSDKVSINLDSLLYIVNFADSCGFVIAGTDDREKGIYAYIEEGNFSLNELDSLNNGFATFFYSLLESKSNDYAMAIDEGNLMMNGGVGGDGYIPDKFDVMFPLLSTQWGQLDPYNFFTPENWPTGCVVTAISQICSFLEEPKSIQWAYNGTGGYAYLNWEQIKSWPSPLLDESKNQVSHLMRYWGVAFDAEYSEESTGVDSEDAIDTMRDLGFNVTGLNDYDINNVINDLRAGNKIIFMRGKARYYHVGFFFRKYVDGHAWVVDGFIDEVKNREQSYYIHCNWGWGGIKNGYYLSDVLNAEELPVFNDNATRSKNYRYCLETATFTK